MWPFPHNVRRHLEKTVQKEIGRARPIFTINLRRCVLPRVQQTGGSNDWITQKYVDLASALSLLTFPTLSGCRRPALPVIAILSNLPALVISGTNRDHPAWNVCFRSLWTDQPIWPIGKPEVILAVKIVNRVQIWHSCKIGRWSGKDCTTGAKTPLLLTRKSALLLDT